MTSQQQLYPIRIDATSNDRQLRIVDTLLWDATLELDHADQLAQQIVADTVVLGMGRAARHFTNRWEIGGDSAEMVTKIAAQIREQWRAIQQRRASSCFHRSSSSATSKKRKRDNDKPTATAAPGVKEKENETTDESNPKENAASVSSPNLIPIHLRMSIHGVRIHDDFDYDPTILNPVQMAQSIGDDLKLTPEMVVAVAVEIAEQVAAAEDPIIFWKGGDGEEDPIEEDEEGPPGDRRHLTAAWHLPHKINVTNVAHLVASSRPVEPKIA